MNFTWIYLQLMKNKYIFICLTISTTAIALWANECMQAQRDTMYATWLYQHRSRLDYRDFEKFENLSPWRSLCMLHSSSCASMLPIAECHIWSNWGYPHPITIWFKSFTGTACSNWITFYNQELIFQTKNRFIRMISAYSIEWYYAN